MALNFEIKNEHDRVDVVLDGRLVGSVFKFNHPLNASNATKSAAEKRAIFNSAVQEIFKNALSDSERASLLL